MIYLIFQLYIYTYLHGTNSNRVIYLKLLNHERVFILLFNDIINLRRNLLKKLDFTFKKIYWLLYYYY